MKTVNVSLEKRSYEIFIKPGLFNDLDNILKKFIENKNCFVITDDNVSKLYGDTVLEKINEAGVKSVNCFQFKAGESSKNIATLEQIYNEMASVLLDRKSVVIALGGGVVGDIAGFAAATFMRGINFIQVPTTLLAMVDSSVGGKTGIDLVHGKNLVGAFWQPQTVIIDPLTLRTLPDREVKSGLAEVVKYGIIRDKDFFEFIEHNHKKIICLDTEIISKIICRCCEIKSDVVKEDEFESGIRAILNYGHTFGHAIEAVTGYSKYTHGEAVSIGMVIAARLAFKLNLIAKNSFDRIYGVLKSLNLQICADSLNEQDIYNAMFKDKKVKSGKINYVIPTEIGHVDILEGLEQEKVLYSIRESLHD